MDGMMRPLAERTSSLPCGCVVGAPCDCDEPEWLTCEYCGDEVEQLYLIVDDFPGSWDEPPHYDEMEVCLKCRDEFRGAAP